MTNSHPPGIENEPDTQALIRRLLHQTGHRHCEPAPGRDRWFDLPGANTGVG